MRLKLTPDQQILRETTSRFLEDRYPVEAIRARRDDPLGVDREGWRRGAALGWTPLLVREEDGGGNVSGSGVVDLSLVAYEFGRHAAPGPLVGVNVVAAALSEAAALRQTGNAGPTDEVLSGVLSGDLVASWCCPEPGPGQLPGGVGVTVDIDGNDVVLQGAQRPVECAGEAEYFLVAGQTGSGLVQVLVPAGTSGLTIRPMRTVDLTRRFGEVTFDDVRLPVSFIVGNPGGGAGAVERQLQLALVMATAEMVGAMQAAFDMTVKWAFNRYSFGRPLASYQALKHRFADMKSWLEASHAIADAAAEAVDQRSQRAAELVSVAKAFVGDYGAELVQDCVQLHGGIGVTFDHDLHLFLRRVTLDRGLYGTPAEHRQRLAALVEHDGAAA
jgi:alkylation response protein AidB-like acyl-CoA dehydrogenase